MVSTLIRKCTVIDVILFIFGILTFIVLEFCDLLIFVLICGFILAKSYFRTITTYQKFLSLLESGKGGRSP